MKYHGKLTKFEKEILGVNYDINDREIWVELEKAVISRNLFWIQYYTSHLFKTRQDRLMDRLGENDTISQVEYHGKTYDAPLPTIR